MHSQGILLRAPPHVEISSNVLLSHTLCLQARHAHLHRQLCQAFMRLAAGLTKAGYLGGLPSLFNTEEERFHQRFASFSVLFRPEPLSYSHYNKSIDMTGKLNPFPSARLGICS